MLPGAIDYCLVGEQRIGLQVSRINQKKKQNYNGDFAAQRRIFSVYKYGFYTQRPAYKFKILT